MAGVLILVLALLDRNFRVLPKAIHEYLPQHHAGLVITDVYITTCSSLNPFSSCKLDGNLWHRIEKDLYLGKTLTSSAYLHITRKKEEELLEDDRVVMDIKVGRIDPSAGAKGSSAPDAEERWEARPGGVWLKRSAKRHASDSKRAVTAVDVLFGDDAVEAREGWAIVGTPLLLEGGSSKIPSAHLTVRRGSQHEAYKPVPRVNDKGHFKIVQLADLHLATGVGKCRDAVPNEYHGGPCEADPRTLEFVQRILDEEKPDLVVLSGDQVNGDTAPDPTSTIFKYAQVLIQRKIPYVSIFGNHDDEETPMSRAAQMALIETLPYSLSQRGPEDLSGVGNYFIEVLAQGTSKHSAVTIWLLDSHSYSPDERHYHGYDWIKKDQIAWFRETAEGLKKTHSEYTKIHMNLAFIHIPLPEYRDNSQYFKGHWKEAPTAPNFNSGFRDALVEQKVVMVSAGQYVSLFSPLCLSGL